MSSPLQANPDAPIISGAPKPKAQALEAPKQSTAQQVGGFALTALSYGVSISSYLSFGTMSLMGRSLSYAGSYLNPAPTAKKVAATAVGQQLPAAPAAPANSVSTVIGSGLQKTGSAISYVAATGPKYMNGKTVAAVAGAYVASNIMPAAVSSLASTLIRSSAESLLAPVAYAPSLVTSLTGLVFSTGLNSLVSLALTPLQYVPTLAGSIVSIVPAEVIVGGALGYMAATKLMGK